MQKDVHILARESMIGPKCSERIIGHVEQLLKQLVKHPRAATQGKPRKTHKGNTFR